MLEILTFLVLLGVKKSARLSAHPKLAEARLEEVLDMPSWRIRLQGEKCDLEYLSGMLSTDEVNVRETNGAYVMRSRRLDSIVVPQAVLKEAQDIVAQLNGAASVLESEFQLVKISGVSRDEEGKPPSQFVYPEGWSEGRLGVGKPTVSRLDDKKDLGESAQRSTPMGTWLEAAGQDQAIGKALRILGSQGRNPGALRKVYDVLKGDMGQPSTMEKLLGVDQDEIKRFIESASDPEISGDYAAHGHREKEPHYPPMLPSGQDSFLRDLLGKWIQWKNRGEAR